MPAPMRGEDVAVRAEIVALLPRLRRFAWSLTDSRDEGDDLVQAGCLKALGALDQYRPGTRVDARMFRILRTGWIDRARHGARRPATSDPETLEALSDGALGAGAAEARLTLAKVRAAMVALPPERREVLALVGIEGLSCREAADIPAMQARRTPPGPFAFSPPATAPEREENPRLVGIGARTPPFPRCRRRSAPRFRRPHR